MCTRIPINSIEVQHSPGVVVGAHELVDAKAIAHLHHPASSRVTNGPREGMIDQHSESSRVEALVSDGAKSSMITVAGD